MCNRLATARSQKKVKTQTIRALPTVTNHYAEGPNACQAEGEQKPFQQQSVMDAMMNTDICSTDMQCRSAVQICNKDMQDRYTIQIYAIKICNTYSMRGIQVHSFFCAGFCWAVFSEVVKAFETGFGQSKTWFSQKTKYRNYN